MDRYGWFADVDTEIHNSEYIWQPVLQISSGCLSLEIWFRTEAECLNFIEDAVLGKPILN